ncbi:MAG: glycosyltransferase [Spirochaetia bacterium]|nr:glycosyltransferase [Spirochaetia bacterium]
MKISIVTPSFNSGQYIRETMQSVISQQGDFSIEYIVVDNCSDDCTKEIVEDIQRQLENTKFPSGCNGITLIFICEPDQGMYDAINKGFSRATGDICAWINANDIYLPGAFNTISTVFTKYPEIHWVSGISSWISNKSAIYVVGKCWLYSQEWLSRGIYGRSGYFVLQESVFWRRTLWDRVGEINHSLKLAGDYYLWLAFSRFAPLVSVQVYLSCFRKVPGQLSGDLSKYRKEMAAIQPPQGRIFEFIIKAYFHFEKNIPAWIRPILFLILFGKHIYRAIRVSSNDEYQLFEGKYYTVINKLK